MGNEFLRTECDFRRLFRRFDHFHNYSYFDRVQQSLAYYCAYYCSARGSIAATDSGSYPSQLASCSSNDIDSTAKSMKTNQVAVQPAY